MRALWWALFAPLVGLLLISVMPTAHLQLLGVERRALEAIVGFLYPRPPHTAWFPAGFATQLALGFAALTAAKAASATPRSWFAWPRPAALLQHWRPILAALVLVAAGLVVYHALFFWFGFGFHGTVSMDWGLVELIMMVVLPVLVAVSVAAFLFCAKPGRRLRFIGLAAAAMTMLQLAWMAWILLFAEIRPGFPHAFSWVQFFTTYSPQIEIAIIWVALQLAAGATLRRDTVPLPGSAAGPIAGLVMAAWILSLAFDRLVHFSIFGAAYPIGGRMVAVALAAAALWLALGAVIEACGRFGGLRGAEPPTPPSRAALAAEIRKWATQIRPGVVALLAFAALAPLIQLLGMLWWIGRE
jgi:hypothetical protein